MASPQADFYAVTTGERLKVGRRFTAVASSDVTPVWSAVSSRIFQEGTAGEATLAVTPPVGHPSAHPLRLSLQSGSLPAGVTLDSAGRKLVADGSQVAGTASGIVLRAESPLSSTTRWRKVSMRPEACPFARWDGSIYGGAKHVDLEWHPVLKRVYSYGGDYGHGVLGQPGSGQVWTVPGSGRKYQFDDSLRNDMFSFDPYCLSESGYVGPGNWRLEHPFFSQDIGGGVPERRPARPDQASLVWDPNRNKFWALYTTLRSEFVHQCNDDGTPDPWAVGYAQTNVPAVMYVDGSGVNRITAAGGFSPDGTYSWVPSPTGGAGTWTKETTARLHYQLGATTSYNGDELITGYGDERIGQWGIVPSQDRIYAFGNQVLYAFDITSSTYMYWPVFQRTGSTYFAMSASQMAVMDTWIYGVCRYRHPTYGNKCMLVGFNTASLGANTTTCDQGSFRFIDLPFDLDPDDAWENTGNTIYGKIQEHAGVMEVDRKIVVACTYTGLRNAAGETRLLVYDHDTQTADTIEPYSDSENFYAGSWCALPDTGEVMFGLTTNGARVGNELLFYRVRG